MCRLNEKKKKKKPNKNKQLTRLHTKEQGHSLVVIDTIVEDIDHLVGAGAGGMWLKSIRMVSLNHWCPILVNRTHQGNTTFEYVCQYREFRVREVVVMAKIADILTDSSEENGSPHQLELTKLVPLNAMHLVEDALGVASVRQSEKVERVCMNDP